MSPNAAHVVSLVSPSICDDSHALCKFIYRYISKL